MMIATGRTSQHNGVNRAAIVALQLVLSLVICQRNVAVFALWNPAAYTTGKIGRITSPVLKKDGLLFTLFRLFLYNALNLFKSKSAVLDTEQRFSL